MQMLIWRRSILPRGAFEEQPAGLELAWRPDLDVFELTDEYLLCLSLPGVRAEEVDVTAMGRTLVVSGERSLAIPHGAVAHLIESSKGRFARQIRLPRDADVDRIHVEMGDGELKVQVPKSTG
jgi:HSP20 family protein